MGHDSTQVSKASQARLLAKRSLADWLTWLMFGWQGTIHHRQASCVSDASRYSTLAPAHWTCMVLQNARKTVEDRRQKSVGAEQLVNKGQG